MGYSKTVIACLLFLTMPSAAVAAETPLKQEGPTQQQLERVKQITEDCRRNTNNIVALLEEEAKKKNGLSVYHFDGGIGVQVMVSKDTFADFLMISCYEQSVAADPVLSGSSVSAENVPTA